MHVPQELACEFLAVFSRFEYALKATQKYAIGDESGVQAAWDTFGTSIDARFRAVEDDEFTVAVDYLWTKPPRKEVIRDGALRFEAVAIDERQAKAQQIFVMIRRVRNNLFHGGKHMPDGEIEAGRNHALVANALTVLRHCVVLDEDLRVRFEY